MEQQIDYKNVKKKIFNTFQEIRDDRIQLVIKNKESGTFNILTQTLKDLYSSHGHFIYELLQNAEDTKATNVKFELFEDKLIFSHDGSNLFEINDIDSITNTANSTKIKDGNTIGKFGIGFKSVFEYTDEPEIMSGKYHFIIEEILIPKEIEDNKYYDNTTFVFPFKNDSQKTAETRRCEVENAMFGLQFGLQIDTLLFLRNIKTIKCIFNDKELVIKKETSTISEIQDLCSIEAIKNFTQDSESNIETSSFYRFFKKIKLNVFNSEKNENEEKEIDIAIAYKKEKDDIVPVISDDGKPGGNVCAFFRCEGEKSNLCFHIHAPFTIKPDREKLKENNKSNDEIISEIGNLVCESIRELKKQDILKRITFLKVLPNNTDGDLGKYNIIRDKIYELFNTEDYVVMKDGQFGSAQGKFISDTNEIQELLPDNELNILFDTVNHNYWIKRPFGSGRDYKFLTSLGIKEFSINHFIKQLDCLYQTEKYNELIANYCKKDIEWFKHLYIALWSEKTFYKYDLTKHLLCLCEDNKLYPFDKCYINNNKNSIGKVNKLFVNSNLFYCKDKKDEDNIRNFFTSSWLKVKEYTKKEYLKDIVQGYIESENKSVEDILLLYYEYLDDNNIIDILKYKIKLKDDDGVWKEPEELFLSDEYKEYYDNKIKYIDVYYKFYNQIHNYNPITKLSIEYFNITKSKDVSDKYKFLKFLISLGVKESIIIVDDINSNDNIISIRGRARGNWGISSQVDYKIEALDIMLQNITDKKIFYFTWDILRFLQFNEYHQCKYRRAQKQQFIYDNSQIVNVLRKMPWMMQIDKDIVSYIKPEDAIRSKLPNDLLEDLTNDNVNNWLKIICFEKNKEKNIEKENQQNNTLSEMGAKDPSAMREHINTLIEIENYNIPKDKVNELIKKALEDVKNQCQNDEDISREREIDDETYKNIENYSASEYANSPKIFFKKDERRIRERNMSNEEYIRKFLDDVYGNRRGNVKCQICGEYMPFKRPNGKDYFEVTELFSKEMIERESKFNRIALCPTCAARYQVYMRNKADKKKDLLKQIINSQTEQTEFNLTLDKNMSLHFDKRHLAELKGILKAQNKKENEKNR